MKLLFSLIVLSSVSSGNFLTSRTREKLVTQFFGVVNFLFDMEEIKPIHEDVTFHLYTRLNPNTSTKLIIDDVDRLKESPFNSELQTIFIIHGYTDHKDRDVIVDMRKALLDSLEINVIVVDWKRLAAFIYFNAASNAISVGKYLAEFLRFLEDCNVDLLNVHLIGHSLGAQISGVAGNNLNGRIGRITGLDPAGPLFEFIIVRNKTECVDKRDAQFVDIIHTSGSHFGIMLPVGHADFYPNQGVTPQPGCTNFITAISCSHIRAVQYFTDSIKRSVLYLAKRCYGFRDDSVVNCSSSSILPMGYFTPKLARGVFYLDTDIVGDEYPL